MRWFLSVVAGLFGCRNDAAAEPDTEAKDPAARRAAVVAALDRLPVGLKVVHTPVKVDEFIGPNANPGDWRYRWTFKTEVEAIDRRLTITQFAILAWDGERWILAADNSRYNSGLLDQATFADWYSCPDAVIRPGRAAVDARNWAGSPRLESFRQKWLYVGVDDQGRLFKGEAVVELNAPAESRPAER